MSKNWFHTLFNACLLSVVFVLMVAVAAPSRLGNQPEDLPALNDALERLAAFDEQKSRIVEMRYFAGMSVEEVAEALGIAAITVKREWARAKAWLYRELSKTEE